MGERYTNIKVLDLDVPLETNSRIYLKSEAIKSLEGVQYPFYGYPIKYTNSNPDESNASHQIEYAHVRGSELFIDIVVLDTPEGIKLQELMSSKEPIKFKMAFEGLVENLSENNDPIMTIIKLITFCYEETWHEV